ncbi:MAG: BMC domain-containing protein [Clostridiales Family XIII bacterium]|nr:BMC domain-containing protein [Clostridiales Family XIII bacterium]
MDTKIIKSPSAGTLEILRHRQAKPEVKEDEDNIANAAAVGLVQGKLIDMIVASDIAEKAVGVTVMDVRGSCPQNMIMLAIYGDTASVEDAIKTINSKIV